MIRLKSLTVGVFELNITRRRFVFGSAGLIALAGGGYGAIELSRPSLLQSPGQSRARRITADDLAPRETDVAIIGAGIVGVMTAMALVQKGYKVAIFEKGVVAGEQSSRAFGWISSLGDSLPRLHLAHPTKAIWASLQQQLGIDATYRVNGLLTNAPMTPPFPAGRNGRRITKNSAGRICAF